MTWDEYFISIAEAVSKKSHCFSWQAGSIIVRDHQILSTGYNGPPSGYPHCDSNGHLLLLQDLLGAPSQKMIDERYAKHGQICPRRLYGYASGKGLEYCPASHAETNAIVQAAKKGISIEGSIIYGAFNMVPCRECSKLIVNSGIKEVVLISGPNDYPQIGISGRQILEACGIKIRIMEK